MSNPKLLKYPLRPPLSTVTPLPMSSPEEDTLWSAFSTPPPYATPPDYDILHLSIDEDLLNHPALQPQTAPPLDFDTLYLSIDQDLLNHPALQQETTTAQVQMDAGGVSNSPSQFQPPSQTSSHASAMIHAVTLARPSHFSLSAIHPSGPNLSSQPNPTFSIAPRTTRTYHFHGLAPTFTPASTLNSINSTLLPLSILMDIFLLAGSTDHLIFIDLLHLSHNIRAKLGALIWKNTRLGYNGKPDEWTRATKWMRFIFTLFQDLTQTALVETLHIDQCLPGLGWPFKIAQCIPRMGKLKELNISLEQDDITPLLTLSRQPEQFYQLTLTVNEGFYLPQWEPCRSPHLTPLDTLVVLAYTHNSNISYGLAMLSMYFIPGYLQKLVLLLKKGVPPFGPWDQDVCKKDWLGPFWNNILFLHSSFNKSFDRLSHLETATTPSIISTLKILSISPNLTHLRVDQFYTNNKVSNGTPQVSLSLLSHLRAPQSLLCHLILTENLTFLEIILDDESTPSPLSLVPVLQHLPSSLKQLAYPDGMAAVEGGKSWRLIATKFRNLETLSIHLCHASKIGQPSFTVSFLQVSIQDRGTNSVFNFLIFRNG